jgi:hypothetical protein
MIDNEYEKLNSSDKDDFKRLANYLLSHTYIIRDEYQPSKEMTVINDDYKLASRLFDLLSNYFELSYWRLEKDDNYGIISLYNIKDHNRLRLDRFTTIFLYMCRLIYEEKREEAASFHRVRTSTSEVIDKMKTLNLLEKSKTTQKERIEAQRTLAHYNIIRKMETSPWNGDGNQILILPSILAIIPNQGINDLKTELEELKTSTVFTESEEKIGKEDIIL